ncbi:MAG TPA: PHP domain-containing protein [Gemmatimonadaceae bacterium]|nr:PHP domain-containing protein [Gemmatimonadaceae bacterium]
MSGPATLGSPAASFVDLHSHSTASDGAFAPAVVVAEALKAGLSAIALTDHDTTAGLAEAMAEGARLGIRVVPGVELSAVEEDHETHILGLHLGSTAPIDAKLAELREMRRTRAAKIVELLNTNGVRITFDSVLEQAAGAAIGRPHVARALIAEGWAVDSRDAFDRYLAAGRPGFVPKDQLTMHEAISIIHSAGGLAIVAHPGQNGTRERIEALVKDGLDGVEVRHPSHSNEDALRLMALVEHFRLVPSGGSDWHGLPGPRTLGAMRVPMEWLLWQDERVRSRGART